MIFTNKFYILVSIGKHKQKKILKIYKENCNEKNKKLKKTKKYDDV